MRTRPSALFSTATGPCFCRSYLPPHFSSQHLPVLWFSLLLHIRLALPYCPSYPPFPRVLTSQRQRSILFTYGPWELRIIPGTSVASNSATHDCSMPGLPVHHQLPDFTQTHVIESVMPFNHLILCRPLLFLPSIFPSIRVFSNESALYIRWPRYWSFSFSISPSNEYSGLISLGWTGWISLQSKGLSRVFSNTTVQKHQFFPAQIFLLSNSHIHTWLLEKP